MDDKNLMENLLLLEKGVCDLYLHGTIEASTQTVCNTFRTALNDSLCMQDTVYQTMASKGWYTTAQAEGTQIDNVKQKFGAQA